MSTVPTVPPLVDEAEGPIVDTRSRGFWGEAWLRFRRRKLAMAALFCVGLLTIVAIAAPGIVGTKPLVCKYKGKLYFPALGYYVSNWENPYLRTEVRLIYPANLKKKDPESWALWPLVYQDPFRRVRDDEWGDRPGIRAGPMAGRVESIYSARRQQGSTCLRSWCMARGRRYWSDLCRWELPGRSGSC